MEKIDVDEYEYVTLLPMMEFAKIENAIPYLKDKTTAMCRNATFLKVLKSEPDAMEDDCTHHIDHSAPTVTPENLAEKIEEIKHGMAYNEG